MLRGNRIVVCGILLLVNVLILGLDSSTNTLEAQDAFSGLVVRDLKGAEHRLWPASNERATVVMFITVDCPIANSYQPEMRRLQEEFEGHGMRFFMIHEGADLGFEKLQQHAKEYEVKATLVADDQHRIARSLGAKVTPEVIVIGAQGKVLSTKGESMIDTRSMARSEQS